MVDRNGLQQVIRIDFDTDFDARRDGQVVNSHTWYRRATGLQLTQIRSMYWLRSFFVHRWSVARRWTKVQFMNARIPIQINMSCHQYSNLIEIISFLQNNRQDHDQDFSFFFITDPSNKWVKSSITELRTSIHRGSKHNVLLCFCKIADFY